MRKDARKTGGHGVWAWLCTKARTKAQLATGGASGGTHTSARPSFSQTPRASQTLKATVGQRGDQAVCWRSARGGLGPNPGTQRPTPSSFHSCHPRGQSGTKPLLGLSARLDPLETLSHHLNPPTMARFNHRPARIASTAGRLEHPEVIHGRDTVLSTPPCRHRQNISVRTHRSRIVIT